MKQIKVLIVEDNQIVALDIKRVLEKLNYEVIAIVKKEVDVFKYIKNNLPNIILMDINLGNGINGIDIAKRVYKTNNIPIIFLSGVIDETIIDSALAIKPAYYLTKPFNKIQLKSAIELVFNQYNQNTNNVINLEYDYSFDIKNKKLYHKDKIQKLGTKETLLLYLLIEANGEIVLFETIENLIWDSQAVSNDAIRLLISRLRKKINYDLIETVYSHGFKLRKKPIFSIV